MTREELKEMAAKVKPWRRAEANRLSRTALYMFRRHDCLGSRRLDMRENCQSCCLLKLEMSASRRLRTRNQPPNVAGWLRDYIQTGRYVRPSWLALEIDHAERNNHAYFNAILRDVRTFGIKTR